MTDTTLTVVEPRGILIDYSMVNALDPNLYSAIPSTDETHKLSAGTSVKIGLEGEHVAGPNPEHFWVDIIERRGVRGFIGRIQNDVQPAFGVKHGDHIVFAEHHIRAIGA